MTTHLMMLGLVISLLGCAAPRRAVEPAPTDVEPLKQELAQLKDTLAHLDNRLGHLESEVQANDAVNEFTAMTIDSVRWAKSEETFGKTPTLLCHVVEWHGYGKMLRFTRMADSQFYLEAEGHPTVEAAVATGGICDSSGSTRFVMMHPRGELDAGTTYRLRPRNSGDSYRWTIADKLAVVAASTAR